MTREEKSTRVGVLLVHGIGEQGRFEHLEAEVRRIATALEAEESVNTVSVAINTKPYAAFGAKQETWRSDHMPPVTIEVKGKNDELTKIDFREVWWADLDEPASLASQIRFWSWFLSMWVTRGHMKSTHPGYTTWMRPVCQLDSRIRLRDRLFLFTVGVVLFLPIITITLASFLFSRVFRLPISAADIFVQYVGDIKLYQQKKRRGKGPLLDIGQAPRVTIRRRMVRSLVQMALDKYDRWYILAHSLGAVVSFNGLMEPEQRLPHYLDKDLWDRAWSEMGGTSEEPLSDKDVEQMIPTRPAWLKPDDIIDRSKLFSKLHGYLTYGSPLEKFAVLWPAIVPMNSDDAVFSKKFEWTNVIDTTDPVAGEITRLNIRGHGPRNVRYKAGLFHILSHTRYLSFQRDTQDNLVNFVVPWLLSQSLKVPDPGNWKWPGRFLVVVQATLRDLSWLVIGAIGAWVLGAVLAILIPDVVDAMPKWLRGQDVLGNMVRGFVPALVLTVIAGIIKRMRRSRGGDN